MSNLPPGPRLAPPIQLLRWIFAPLPFMQSCAERYGDPFTIRLISDRPMVFFSDPGAIKQIFTADPDQFRAGGANKIFETLFGPNSLLLLDGTRHRRERKLLMPPFHGERMRLYGEMMSRITDQSISGWPVGVSFPIYPHLQAITLDVILRVVFGLDDQSRYSRLRTVIVDALRLLEFGNPFRPIVAWWRFGPSAVRSTGCCTRRSNADAESGPKTARTS